MVCLRRWTAQIILLLGVFAVQAPAFGDTSAPLDPSEVIARSEAAIGGKLGPHVLTRSDGTALPLASFRGRPLAISLVYTSCASVCPVTTQRLLDAVKAAQGAVGSGKFAVLTVGFDARNDTPERMAAFGNTQGIDVAGWQLATADSGTITALLDDLGFSFRNAAGGIEHITQTSIIDAEGAVYRHIYGDDFPDQIFVEPLKELVFGTSTRSLAVNDLVDRIKFLCTVYDPATGAYRYDYSIGFGIAIGGFSLLLTGIIIFRLWRNNRRLLATGAHHKDLA